MRLKSTGTDFTITTRLSVTRSLAKSGSSFFSCTAESGESFSGPLLLAHKARFFLNSALAGRLPDP